MEEPRVFVSIYCMVFKNEFSDEMFNKWATGTEIYDFLMKDAGLCMDDNGQMIPGDCNLCYLGCNEKSGCLKYKDKVFQWDFGDSSFFRVITFISLIYKDYIFTNKQFRNLFDKILEGRRIDCMYDIKNYLIAKREGKKWTKTKRAYRFRVDIKRFVDRVSRHFQDETYFHYFPTVH